MLALISLVTYSLFVDEKRFTQSTEGQGIGERVEGGGSGGEVDG